MLVLPAALGLALYIWQQVAHRVDVVGIVPYAVLISLVRSRARKLKYCLPHLL